MLIELSIQNFAIIDDLSLEFNEGLSVISGETGAGKSITVDALALILGGKADTSAIQHNKEQCNLTATFDISNIAEAKAWLLEQSIEIDDSLCIIRRIISRKGPSRNFINNQAMPLTALKILGEFLVDIHGQQAHQSLTKSDMQRKLVDQYAGIEEEVRALGTCTKEMRAIEKKLHTLSHQDASMRERAEFLKFQLQEFKTLKPQENEWAAITQKHDHLSNFEERLALFQECAHYLSDDDRGINRQLVKLQSRLNQLAQKDGNLKDLAEMIDNAVILCTEVDNDLSRHVDSDELDPKELQMVERRMRELNDLARKHHIEPEYLIKKQLEIEEELSNQFLSDEALQELKTQSIALQNDWRMRAEKISNKRKTAAKILNKEITGAMQNLAMAGGVFEVAMVNQEAFHPQGSEAIEFLVSANPGSPLKPLAKVASGGELSRISLSISVILSMKSALPTLIFDEIDAGVGGAVAEMIGKHLQNLSRGRQVICVTHLPQVASFGHHHFMVAKNKARDSTETHIHRLDSDARINEIARMLGGVTLTTATFEHAKEMLASNQKHSNL